MEAALKTNDLRAGGFAGESTEIDWRRPGIAWLRVTLGEREREWHAGEPRPARELRQEFLHHNEKGKADSQTASHIAHVCV
jgi:hypothetical protein